MASLGDNGKRGRVVNIRGTKLTHLHLWTQDITCRHTLKPKQFDYDLPSEWKGLHSERDDERTQYRF
jgi:hypothetical protein